jgi:hypothetical protein
MNTRAATIVAVLCSGLATAEARAADPVVTGHVRDARGDATVSQFLGPPGADVKRVSVRYDPAAGRFVLESRLFRPAPSVYALKALFASPTCASTGADVLDYDVGGSAILRINGAIPLSVTRRTVREGRRLTETWSGPELRGLDLSCVRGSVSTGGIGGFGVDEFGPLVLR